jgi:tetratricopeptide (TPR) repeat protein
MLTNDSIEDLTREITDLEKREDEHRAKREYRWNPMADLERQQRGQVHRDRARLYAEQKEFDKAVVDYQAAISLGCDNSWVYGSLGAAYYGLGRYQDAGEAYKSALAKLRYEERGTDYFSRYEEKVASCGIQQALLDYHNGAIDPLGLQVRINGALRSLPDDGRDSVLWRSSRENPQDVAAQILAFLLPRFLSVGDLKLIPLIQADPDEVEKLAGWICPLESWPEEEPSESRRRALLLIAIAQYEAGDQELVEDWVNKTFPLT